MQRLISFREKMDMYDKELMDLIREISSSEGFFVWKG